MSSEPWRQEAGDRGKAECPVPRVELGECQGSDTGEPGCPELGALACIFSRKGGG